MIVVLISMADLIIRCAFFCIKFKGILKMLSETKASKLFLADFILESLNIKIKRRLKNTLVKKLSHKDLSELSLKIIYENV